MKRLLILLLVLAGAVSAADLTPSIKTACGANSYTPGGGISIANARWYGEHYDIVCAIAGMDETYPKHIADSIKAGNPAAKLSYYTNLTSLGNRSDGAYVPWEYRAFTRHTDSAGVDIDDMFFHLGDSVIVQTLAGGTRTIPLDSLRTAGCDSCTRVSLRGWYNTSSSPYYLAGDGDWLCNYYSDIYKTMRRLTLQYIYQHQTTIFGVTLDTAIGYVWGDNWCPSYNPALIGYFLTGVSAGTYISASMDDDGVWDYLTTDVDFVERTAIQTNQYTYLSQEMVDATDSFQVGMEAVGAGGLIVNVSRPTLEWAYKLAHGGHPAGYSFENLGEGIVGNYYGDPYNTNWHSVIPVFDTTYKGDPTVMQLQEYRFKPAISDTLTATAGTDPGRCFRNSFASFLCLQYPDVSYFQFGRSDKDFWFSGQMADLGAPVTVRYDSTIVGGQIVFWRRYKKGLAFWRPKMTALADTTAAGAVSLTYADIGLGDTVLYKWGEHYGGTYKPLDTLNSADVISIKAQDGWVYLFSTTALTMPEIAFTPTSFTFTAVYGGARPANQILSISNSGIGDLNWTLTDDMPWLTMGTTSGTNTGSTTVGAWLSGLAVGSYYGTIVITAAGASNTPQGVPVTFTVTPAESPISSKHVRIRK